MCTSALCACVCVCVCVYVRKNSYLFFSHMHTHIIAPLMLFLKFNDTHPTPPSFLITDDPRVAVFSTLQPICSVILQSRSNPPELTSLLSGLDTLLQEVDVQGLQACIEYVLFPLRLILDCASGGGGEQQKQQHQHQHQQGGVAIPAASSERVVEATLKCLFTVLCRCNIERKEQILSVIARLTALLPENNNSNNSGRNAGVADAPASEEVVQSILINLVCLFTNMPPPGKAILTQDDEAAPLIGHLISKLLSTAEGQFKAGSLGSRLIGAKSFHALRTLIEAIHNNTDNGNNDTNETNVAVEMLAFFIPGIATGLASALVNYGRTEVGSTNSLAVVEALKGLRSLLVATMGSDTVARLMMDDNDGTASGTGAIIDEEWVTSDQAMAQLRRLAGNKSKGIEAADIERDMILGNTKGKTPSFPPSSRPTTTTTTNNSNKLLKATLTVEWLMMTSSRLSTLLIASLPPLASHPNPTVRQTLVPVCADIADHCGGVVTGDTQRMLLQMMLSLAEDEWQDVAMPAKLWLHRQQTPLPSSALRNTIPPPPPPSGNVFNGLMEPTLLQLVKDLPEALQKGEDSGALHARQLTAALLACLTGPNAFNNIMVNHPTWLDACVSSFTKCFLPDLDAAALLLHAPLEMATAYASVGLVDDSNATTTTTTTTATTDNQYHQGTAVAVALLPRMPLALSLICSNRIYVTISKATHELSAAAASSDSSNNRGDGLSLRTLFDACLLRLERLLERANNNSGSNDKKRKNMKGTKNKEQVEGEVIISHTTTTTTSIGGDDQWQLEATSLISLLSEFIYGTLKSIHSSSGSQIRRDVESLVFSTLSLIVSDIIWKLPTSMSDDDTTTTTTTTTTTSALLCLPLQLTSSSSSSSSMKHLGSNVLLQRAALECIGAAARVVGTAFSTNGKFMRLVLLPLFEKLADASPLVRSSADAALTSICVHCGYHGSMNMLISGNVDYIIDGLCRQLRNVQQHSRAPQLFAALLSRAGTAPEVLLPMLAEPAQRALRGVSILARSRSPEYVLPFLAALKEVAVGAEGVGRKALKRVQALAADVELKYQKNVEARKKEKMKMKEQEEGSLGTDSSSPQSIEHIAGYFKERADKGKYTPWDDDEDDDIEERACQVDMSPSDREELRLARRQAAAAASLARSITDCSGPLTASSSLSIAVQAINVCMSALQALKSATEIIELEEEKIEPFVKKQVDLHPPEPDVPRLLPSVHLFWAPLIGALKDWRVALIEAAAPSLATLAHLSGSFLTKRFAQEAWPIMLSLLRHGPSGRSSSSSHSQSSPLLLPGDDVSEAPALTQRARLAVLDCLKSIALNTNSSVILTHYNVAPAALSAVGELLKDDEPPNIKEAATTTFMALAEIDGDAAWALLSSALHIYHPTIHITNSTILKPPPLLSSASASSAVLPSYDEIFSKSFLINDNRTQKNSTSVVPVGFKECNGKKLKAMLGKLEQLPVRWHNCLITT